MIMPRFPIQFIKKYDGIFLRNEKRPLLWKFKKSLSEDKIKRSREMNREINISHKEWFEAMLSDSRERPLFLL